MPFQGFCARADSILARRVARFALVGTIGVPINVGFLWLFHREFRLGTLIAWVMAFECSALINFYANQRFTYHDQTHVRGVEWLWRALRAQLSSVSGVVVNALIFGLLLASGLHYLEADAGGIVGAFACNFFIANRFVFTPAIQGSENSFATGAGGASHRLRRDAKADQVGAVDLAMRLGQEGEHARRILGSLAQVEEIA